MTENPLDPLAQEALITARLKESGYVMHKINFITWRVIDVHTGLTYALSLRSNLYCCLPLLGNELGAAAIQQIVRTAVQQAGVQNPELIDNAADLEDDDLGESRAVTDSSDTAILPIEEQVERRKDEDSHGSRK